MNTATRLPVLQRLDVDLTARINDLAGRGQ